MHKVVRKDDKSAVLYTIAKQQQEWFIISIGSFVALTKDLLQEYNQVRGSDPVPKTLFIKFNRTL